MHNSVGDRFRVETARGDGFSLAVRSEGGALSGTLQLGRDATVVDGAASLFVISGFSPDLVRRRLLASAALADAVYSASGGFAVAEVAKDGSGVEVATDRIASRKVFHAASDSHHVFSTDLGELPLGGRPLDPAGIACFLSSEGMLDGLTPYQGVTVLPRASITSIAGSEISSERYWDFVPHHDVDPVREVAVEEMRALLDGLMASAAGTGPVWVSLSGGLDSRSQAAYLVRRFGRDRVKAVTYHHGTESADSDVTLARWAADLLGIELVVVDGYRGDLMTSLDANARFGRGVARICDEVDAWVTMADRWAHEVDPVLIVGDLFGQHPRRDFTSADGYLRICGVRPVRTIEWFLSLVPDAEALRSGWDTRYEEIRSRAASFADPMNGWEYTYLDQRITHTLGSWRDMMQSPFVRVAAPYVQAPMLDFMAGIPWKWKVAEDAVYQHALQRDFPSLFERPGAAAGWNQPSWLNEVRAAAGDLLEALAEPSPLDAVIPPATIQSVVEQLRRNRSRDSLWERLSRFSTLKNLYRPVADRSGRVPARSPARLVRDVMVLRRALAHLERRSNSAGSPLGRVA